MFIVCLFRVTDKYENNDSKRMRVSLYSQQKHYMACEEVFGNQMYVSDQTLFNKTKIHDFIKITYTIETM